jgi:diacylglycerol kinase (ATP)
MRHILYIINPISGTNTKRNLRSLVEKRTGEAGIAYSIFPSVANADYRFLHDHIRTAKVTDIVIAGGDGTVNQVVSALRHFDLNFGIIPCGSGNGLAYTAKIPRAVGPALDLVFTGKAIPTDGFKLNDRFACMLAGLGFDAKVAHDFAQQPGRGLTNYVKQVVRNFFSANTYSFDITFKENKFNTQAYFISIANSNQFGNNFRIAPKASLRDGLLDIVIITKQNKLKLLLQMLNQFTGKNKLQADALIDHEKAVVYFQAASLQIKNISNAPLHIDGDPVETIKELSVKVKPACFKLISR